MSGELLKKRREDLGLDIPETAELLKIKSEYLRAIEHDEFGKLPVSVYTKGYIRCYAKHLGIDADPIIEYYTKHLAQPNPSAIMPVGFSQKKSPKILSFVLGLFTAIAVSFLVFFVYQTHNEKIGPPLTATPGNIAIETEPVRPDIPLSPSAETQEIPRDPTQWQADHTDRPREAFIPPDEESPREVTPVSEITMHNLEIRASETTWTSITFDDGRSDETLFQPGISKSWTFSGKASLKIGNAGGIRIFLDGDDIGLAGKSGQVVTMSLPRQ